MHHLLERFRLPSFRHGVHPDECKDATNQLAIERMPFVAEYVMPLAQHLGRPAEPAVQRGMRVQRGQLIAKPSGFISTALHAPVTGTVVAIDRRPHPTGRLEPAIVIQIDPWDSQEIVGAGPVDPRSLPPAQVVSMVQQAGIVGLGGAAFPTHVKFSVPEGKRVRFVILNGCECEPYLTCDDRVMVEQPADVLRGLEILMQHVGAERGYIGIEANKPGAIAAMREAVARRASAVEVVPLQVKYPQGAEKMLIYSIFQREVPSGKLPLDIEIVVNNVGTSAALATLFDRGIPLVERVVAVTGSGVKRPANLIVPLGTPVQAVLDYCGLDSATGQVILGGPMMGQAQKRLDVPVIKGTSGILATLEEQVHVPEELPCIRCGRCLEACPMFLNPSRLAQLVRAEKVEALSDYHVMDCFECASCSYSCPSTIPLVQLIRVGKALVREHAAAK